MGWIKAKGVPKEGPKFRTKCSYCQVPAGSPHVAYCDWEHCSVCGSQRHVCECKGHKRKFVPFTGYYPGEIECYALGWFIGWDGAGITPSYDAEPDINRWAWFVTGVSKENKHREPDLPS